MRTLFMALAMGACCTACGDNAEPEVRGPHRTFAMTKQLLPLLYSRSPEYGEDLDGDGEVDNQMGAALNTFRSYGLETQEFTDQLLDQGLLAMAIDIQIPGPNDGPSAAGLTTVIGNVDSPPPVPVFREGNDWVGHGGSLSVMTGFFNAPIQLDLANAHVSFAEDVSALTGKIAGGVSKADVTGKLIPAATVLANEVVRRDCANAMALDCLTACTPDTNGKTILGLFDADHDCIVTADEIRQNSLIVSVVSPDVWFDDVGYLSFGFRFEAVAE
jgi:hypothetical protein